MSFSRPIGSDFTPPFSDLSPIIGLSDYSLFSPSFQENGEGSVEDIVENGELAPEFDFDGEKHFLEIPDSLVNYASLAIIKTENKSPSPETPPPLESALTPSILTDTFYSIDWFTNAIAKSPLYSQKEGSNSSLSLKVQFVYAKNYENILELMLYKNGLLANSLMYKQMLQQSHLLIQGAPHQKKYVDFFAKFKSTVDDIKKQIHLQLTNSTYGIAKKVSVRHTKKTINQKTLTQQEKEHKRRQLIGHCCLFLIEKIYDLTTQHCLSKNLLLQKLLNSPYPLKIGDFLYTTYVPKENTIIELCYTTALKHLKKTFPDLYDDKKPVAVPLDFNAESIVKTEHKIHVKIEPFSTKFI